MIYEIRRKIMKVLGRWKLIFKLSIEDDELQITFKAAKHLIPTIIRQVRSCLTKGYKSVAVVRKKINCFYPSRRIWDYGNIKLQGADNSITKASIYSDEGSGFLWRNPHGSISRDSQPLSN